MTRRAPLPLMALSGLALLAGCATAPQHSDPSTAGTAPSSTVPAASQPASVSATTDATRGSVSCEYSAAGSPARPVDPPPGNDVEATGTVSVTLDLTAGPVTLTLDRAAAPCTVNSFLALAQQGFYDDTTCHRLVDQGIFVLQCGDPTGTGRGGPGYTYPDELTGDETYTAGTVAMANAGPDTNGSQFFLVWADSPLDPDYTVFGTMDEASLEVVTTIASRGVSKDASPNPIAEARIQRVSLG